MQKRIRTGRWFRTTVVVAGSLLIGGCYTVFHAPHRTSSASPTYEAERSSRDTAQWEDLYRYPGSPGGLTGGYGGGYGYGGYGGYGYPQSPGIGFYGGGYPYTSSAYYGYGPFSYGYDPYYFGAPGYYAPPGYRLVTQAELAALEANIRALERERREREQAEAEDPEERLQRELEEERRAREIWNQRNQPQDRPAPTLAPSAEASRTAPSTYTAPQSSGGGSSSGSSSSGSSSSSEEESSPRPRRQRR